MSSSLSSFSTAAATPALYTLSLHDALPICARGGSGNPGESCLPGDVFLVSPFLYKIIQPPTVLAILWEGNVPAVVQIFLDGRPHAKDAFPTWMGDLIGRWERDTLVVDTVGFNDQSWIRIFPHTEMLHVVQRYTRPN